MQGNLIIITSPSGGGKGTLIREILQRVPNLAYSVSLTTRERRTGEVDGHDYNFVTKDEFEKFRQEGGFLEYAEVHGNYYGTSAAMTERLMAEGKDVILEIDVQGAARVVAKVPEAVSIFILPPSFEALADRLKRRATENADQLMLRLRNSFGEVSRYSEFEYLVINDNVPDAVRRLESVILGERQRRARQTEAIRDILISFEASKHALGRE
jgi:guanylate kinase